MNNDSKVLAFISYIFLLILQLILMISEGIAAYTYFVLLALSPQIVVLAIISVLGVFLNATAIAMCIAGMVKTNAEPQSHHVLNGFSLSLLFPLIYEIFVSCCLMIESIVSISVSGPSLQTSIILIASIISLIICFVVLVLLITSMRLNKRNQLLSKKMTLIVGVIILVVLGIIGLVGNAVNILSIVILAIEIIVYLLIIITAAVFKYDNTETNASKEKHLKSHNREPQNNGGVVYVTPEQMVLIKQVEQLEANGVISPDEALKKKLEIANRK